MARRKRTSAKREAGIAHRLRRWRNRVLRAVLLVASLVVLWVLAYSVINPPSTPYMLSEKARLDGVRHQWAAWEDIAPRMPRAAVAAEDANFCLHWGFDMGAIRAALADGRRRGASTISQQVTKNAFLWHGRSWLRKALEALITPLVELTWSKRRILEVYLNIAEFDEGVFGVEAAAQHYFGVPASKLNGTQAALLAAVLPAPQDRSAARPSGALQKRAASIMDGAATIRRDGRAACFED
ncbi:MAG: monofunctional biosynthetic peptidoglycan transglycosylase [Sediminimonas qiaohouensis]|uniref:Biosynthetic peptidoglycan transglycosylase n=1 Tax=Sediminimonas qiaohouensis TaxID=552061 RepID=A0A7C9LBC7_9RHOB|nr:monofunctional biosynthetic peptidoglycan transglycosylase [Sediminimonas qiaohouensis]MTJ05058.1 monofunctional biosynthetic peptidoglycan transglycosylase [Sediminimonas qiaohouensis]